MAFTIRAGAKPSLVIVTMSAFVSAFWVCAKAPSAASIQTAVSAARRAQFIDASLSPSRRCYWRRPIAMDLMPGQSMLLVNTCQPGREIQEHRHFDARGNQEK